MRLKLGVPTRMWAAVKRGAVQRGLFDGQMHLYFSGEEAKLLVCDGATVERVLVTVERAPKAMPCPVLKSKRTDMALMKKDNQRVSKKVRRK